MSYSIAELELFQQLYKQSMAMVAETSHTVIAQHSCFSQRINSFIRSVKELRIYQQFNLKEAVLTRPALILDIDPDYRTPNGETNAERMMRGLAPYDATTGSIIDLHHIGQQYDAPFAELPHCIHNGTGISSILHYVKKPSWRNEPNKVKEYLKESTAYWKQRGEAV